MTIFDMTLAEIEADPVDAIEKVRAARLNLSSEGFDGPLSLSKDYAGDRAEMTNPRKVEQFLRAVWFLSSDNVAKYRTKGLTCVSSYAWKHVAETWAGSYVSNGMFLAAAVALGFQAKQFPRSPNGSINLGKRALPKP